MHADTVGLKGLREVILACGGSQGCLLLFTRDACLKRFIDVPFQWKNRSGRLMFFYWSCPLTSGFRERSFDWCENLKKKKGKKHKISLYFPLFK